MTAARSNYAWVLWATALVVVTVAVYWPGLAGGFLFDDMANLPALGRYGPIVDLPGLLRYLTSGIADPTGRPVAMLSFLIDANHWPAEAWPFKRTNLVIHALNALLLLRVLRQLGHCAGVPATHAARAALIAAALWALHPLWVSSVMYVVQRHALLATTFVLLGMSIWLTAQQAFAEGRQRRGWFLATAAVCGCGLLAGFSKPIGFLLPLLLLVIHATIARGGFPHMESSSRWPGNVWILLILPSALLLIALCLYATTADTQDRPWSIAQRAASQPRAIMSYLYYLVLPTPFSPGLFADDFQASTTLFNPVSTLPALVTVFVALMLALVARARHRILSLAILFFLAGHVMESGVLPLELYFEHRNYLPALLLFWPLALWLAAPGQLQRWRRAGTLALLVLLSLLTLARASIWGNPLQLAQIWARDLPDSARAQTFAASSLAEAGHVDAAIGMIRPLVEQHPEEPQLALALMNAQCMRGRIDGSAFGAVAEAAARAGIGADILHSWITSVLKKNPAVPCYGLEIALLLPIIDGLRSHPRHGEEEESRMARVEGYLAMRENRCEDALAAFNRRLDIQRRPEAVVEQIGYLATLCGDDLGIRHLEHFREGAALGYAKPRAGMLRVRDWLMQRQGYWDRELAMLEDGLRREH